MNKSKKIPSKNDCFFTYFIAPSVEFQRRGGLLEANAVFGGGGFHLEKFGKPWTGELEENLEHPLQGLER